MYGEEIKEYLDENGIKYNFIAQETGISVKTLNAILNLKRKLTVDGCVKWEIKKIRNSIYIY